MHLLSRVSPAQLPIYDIEVSIVEALKASRRLILQAPTGSGKSTQVPQILLKHGLLNHGQCVILQPRRLAARLLASRVASELGCRLGQQVGFQVRFENVTSPTTQLKFETEGILLRQLVADPTLKGVSAIVFDEFHERHLYGDITLARALDIQESHRPDLLIVVMSATLNANELQPYLNRYSPAHTQTLPTALHRPCSVLTSEGRTFPVDIRYLPKRLGANPPPVWELAADAFDDFRLADGTGDVLVFMPGGFEIAQTITAIRSRASSRGYLVLPLHGELSPKEQETAVTPQSQPKVVVSTNVAETSVTIDGIRLVIDSGLARIARYDPNRGLNTLLVERISQASADQRAGRAGRTAPGQCLRLWSEAEHQERPPDELPEVKRLDLAEVVLTLKAAEVQDLRQFRWLESPDELALSNAERLLQDLGALEPVPPANAPTLKASQPNSSSDTTRSRITPTGRKMLAFPVHPRYARMLLAAQDYGCVHQACLAAALTQGRDLLLRDPQAQLAREALLGTSPPNSDLFLLLQTWQHLAQNQFRPELSRRLGIALTPAHQLAPVLDQFLRIAKEQGLDTTSNPPDDESLRKCILIGFNDRVGRRLDTASPRCELTRGRRASIAHDSSVRNAPLFVASEVREVSSRNGDVTTLLSTITAIEGHWLTEFFPQEITCETTAHWDPQSKRVYALESLRFRGLVLSTTRTEPPPPDAAATILADEISAGRLELPLWNEAVENWLQRLRFLCKHCPDLQLPPIEDSDRRAIVEQLCHGAFSHKDVRERDVLSVVTSWLSPAQRNLLDKHAPERLRLPNGRTPKLHFLEGQIPFISLRIQELYDVQRTPRIALDRVPVVVHILTPGMKPIQVTSDLTSFWRDHYPRIKSELQRRYPKHLWK